MHQQIEKKLHGFFWPSHRSHMVPLYLIYWLYWSKQCQTCPYSKGEDIHGPHLSMGGMAKHQEIWLTTILFHSHTIIFWGNRSYIPTLQMRALRFKQPTSEPMLQISVHMTHCLSFLMPFFALGAPQIPPAQIPWCFFPHLFLLVYLLQISFCPAPPSHLYQPQGLGWKCQERHCSDFCQSLMSAT